jgi:signal transduction histidine kinase
VRDPGRVVSVLANDRDGALLLAGRRDIERIYQGKSSRIALPAPGGKPVDLDVIGLQDDGKILWMATLQTGPMGLVDGHWVPFSQFKYPRPVFMTAPAGPGALWLAHNNGSMSLADNGKITAYDISAVGQVSGIFPGPQVLVGGELGVAALLGDKFVLLGHAGVEALRNVTGAAVTPDGDRWLNGAKGAVHIRRADWEAALRNPAAPLAYELIDAQEGYPGRAALDNRLPSLYSDGHGRLWFRTTSGLARLDTASLQANPVKPVAQLLRVVTASRSYPAGAMLRLPPDTRSFDIQYTAPGLRKPEGMRFQYLLEGVDQDWRDAGTRRAAYYTNIGPGRYRFNVRAVNEDGVAGDATSSMQIEVAPTITQTGWFRALCVLAAALLLYGLYKYRLNVVKAALARQLQARTAERERIARTLHDTFLQSVQALILRVHAVLMNLPEGSEPRNKLATILDDADRALGEGRNQVRQLRSGQDIEQHLRESGASLAAIYTSTSFTLDVAGERCQLSPPVQEEVCAICAEALRNAFQHAHASAVSVRIDYRDAILLFAVSDNGRGIEDAEVRARQQQNHWGVVGMRERARSIGGELDIASLPGRGTFVTLRVPRMLACAEGATSA